MIRLIFVMILFLIYGNFSFVINDIVVLSLINIAFYTVLKEKNIKIKINMLIKYCKFSNLSNIVWSKIQKVTKLIKKIIDDFINSAKFKLFII